MVDVSDMSLDELSATVREALEADALKTDLPQKHDQGHQDAGQQDDQPSQLTRSLRRLAEELAEPGEPTAGFNSAL
jgi:hypothetical protein